MKRLVLFALLLFACAAAGQDSVKQVTLKKDDRILFYGDSLTAQAMTPKGWGTLPKPGFTPVQTIAATRAQHIAPPATSGVQVARCSGHR